MKRFIIASVLSLITFIGGHLYNRRWDRALLFFSLLVLMIAGLYVSISFISFGPSSIPGEGRPEQFMSAMQIRWRIFLFLLAAVWLISVIISAYDARQPSPAFPTEWTKGGIFGAIFASILSAAIGVTFTGLATLMQMPARSSITIHAIHDDTDTNFTNHVYFGGYPNSRSELPAPPKGNGFLQGRFMYNGAPAANVSLKLALNGQYETGVVITDRDGVFTVRVPVGAWRINRLDTEEWKDRPKDPDLMVVTGKEGRLENGTYQEAEWWRGQGLEVAVTEKPPGDFVTFVIRPLVKLQWPAKRREAVPASAAKDIIQWDIYPGATDYRVSISELKREGQTTQIIPVAARLLTGTTRLALKDIKAVASVGQKHEYEVEVRAFAKDGGFLSKSDQHFEGHRFDLTDHLLVADVDTRMLGGNFTDKEFSELHKNQARFTAVEVLIEDGLLTEAEKLLAKVTGKAEKGRKKALTGYLFAMRGNCAQAKILLNEAQAEGGTICLPGCYWGKCAAQK
ncbi:MAG TPA: hypothetical protein VK138_09085 [Acidiferrobacterales bacterium]|nr:hypothetical protein [Acidiferrobacterales bacterium]